MGCKDFKKFCVGDFIHEIVIEKPIRTPDGQGGNTITYITHATPFAKIEPKKAQQVFFAQQLQHQVSHKLTMRFVPGVTAEMRIRKVSDGKIFEIRQIIDVLERKRFHEIMAWENKQS